MTDEEWNRFLQDARRILDELDERRDAAIDQARQLREIADQLHNKLNPPR